MPSNANPVKKKTKTRKVIKLDQQNSRESNPKPLYDPEELIFALDIGTRTVVGVVGFKEKDKFRVLAAESVEHKNRAMLDGQIHDIDQVAFVASEVRTRLEKKLGISLTKVAIAAAGRVLMTCEVKVEREIEQGREIDRQIIGSLEMEGIQQAQLKLEHEILNDEKSQFYCVGYSVINYYLNDYVIASLLGHRGKKIGAEILATFLPHIVVDSLYTVMSKIGLEVISLTLEPIAAINVTIPKDLRMLNLALVDIGAGTSDIALTRDGSVVAYAMAPVAGDEITEKIAQQYLLDFNEAEKVKTSLSTKVDAIHYVDILGIKHSVKSSEVTEVIRASVELLAETIAGKILEYNHKAPNAVFLIGGGSQIPGLPELVAEHLKLPKERVALRSREVIQNIKYNGKKLAGPEAITPFGIAVTAQMQQGQDFLSVTINGRKVRLFNSRKLSVSDALILIGFNPGQLIGRSGKSLNFTLNGDKKTIRGGWGKPAEIFVNESPANLTTILKPGDSITVQPAEDGASAEIRVSDIAKNLKTGTVTLNNSSIDIGTKVLVNGSIASLDQEIHDGDQIQMNEIRTIRDLLIISEINHAEYEVLVNGRTAGEFYELQDADAVECRRKSQQVKAERKIESELPKEQFSTPIPKADTATEQITATEPEPVLPEAFNQSSVLSVVVNGKPIEINGEKKQYMFIDIFNFISFDLTKPQGNIVLKLNGRQAGFTDEIQQGDKIDIYWEK
ncbi:MAG: pilus assembly protein PilM [Clostridia bacterium]|nr:pilus assembly protein PilM [Clostridia bacterium]